MVVVSLMSKSVHHGIHEVILRESDHRFSPEINADQRLRILFKNFRRTGSQTHGLRLSATGHKVLSRIFTCWEYKHNKLSNKTLIDLDTHMTWPYYLGRDVVAFYSELDAAMFRLNGGELSTITEII